MESTRFGRLVVLEFHSSDAHHNRRWLCRCDCGNEKVVLANKLRNGETRSCGCLAKEHVKRLKDTAAIERRAVTKSTYKSMVKRCHDPRNDHFKSYGGKGRTVCPRWLFGDGEKTGWECFFEDMGPKPEGLTLERKDNKQGYSPDNCVWATWAEQFANTIYRKP